MTSPAGNESTFIYASGHGEDAGIFEDTTLAIKFTISTNNCEDLFVRVGSPTPVYAGRSNVYRQSYSAGGRNSFASVFLGDGCMRPVHYSKAYMGASEDPKAQVIELYSEGTQTHLFCLTAQHLAKFTLPPNWVAVE